MNGCVLIKWKRGTLMFYLICVWINGWVNNREAGDLRPHRAHYDVIVMAYGLIRTESIYTLHHYVARAIVRLRKSQRSKPADEHGQLYHINPWELIITRKYNAIDVCWMVRTYNPQKIVWLFLIIWRGRSAKSKNIKPTTVIMRLLQNPYILFMSRRWLCVRCIGPIRALSR